MKKNLLLLIVFGLVQISYSQTNIFPIYSNGNYSGGSGDYTNVSNAQLKLQASSGYVRIPHVSSNSTISAVYNFQTNKSVYWGEPSDLGNYFFRGRDFIVQHGDLGIGTDNPTSKLHLEGTPWTGIKIKDVTTSGGRGISNQYLDGNNDGWKMYFGGHYSGQPLRFSPMSQGVQGATALTIWDNGNVGIGTEWTDATLHVKGNTVKIENTQGNAHTWLPFNNGEIYLTSDKDGSGSGKIHFRTFSNTESYVERMVINGDGNVGIGTTNPDPNFKLSVNGSIRSKEVKVEANWSDFVFYDNYELRTLQEVEQHINEKGHLPEIPSESEVTENGINLGEMDAKLLQKIEELTLYMIDMNKRVNELETENKELKEKVNSLENE